MKLMNSKRPVMASWLRRLGHRLDAPPHLSKAVEAKRTLEALSEEKTPLVELTEGGISGIVHAGRIPRVWVRGSRYGLPFISTSSMLHADLSFLPHIAHRVAADNPKLTIESNWILISRSGSIGRTMLSRPEMHGMACTEDILRIIPDSSKISPEYLFAFLSSNYGVPIVTSQTYGAIIRHIEPEHIVDLPVPRFGTDRENAIADKVRTHVTSLSRYNELMEAATNELIDRAGINSYDDEWWFSDERINGWGESHANAESLRALNYDPRANEIRSAIEQLRHSPLGTLCVPERFKGKCIFTRVDAAPEHGALLVGQRKAFHFRPEGRWISKKSISGLGLQVPRGTTLIPSHGTLGEYELYCRAVYVTSTTSEYAFSGDFFRCIPISEEIPPGYMFAFLRSKQAFRMLRSISIGGKQQEQHRHMMYRLPVPRFDRRIEKRIAESVDEAADAFDRSLKAQNESWELIERYIAGE